MTDPQASGADLARVALMAARKAAKTAPTNPKAARKKRTSSRRGDGRDPIALGTAITRLVDERAWETPTAGGSILDQWPTIAPELVGKVAAERFDADSGTLHLRPASAAYGTQLRMFGQQMIDRINAKTGGQIVRAIRVLAPGAATARPDLEAPAAAPERPAQPASPRTRAEAPDGYHRALEAALAGRERAAASDPTAEARDRMFGSIRGTLREPVEAFTDAVAALEDVAPPSRGNDSETIRQAALKRARDERAGRAPAIPTAFQRTA